MKSEEMNRLIKELTGIDINKAVEEKICPSCHKPLKKFRDEISERESKISGMCQQCQDEIFGTGYKKENEIFGSQCFYPFHKEICGKAKNSTPSRIY